ncbi:hypothetical protein D3C71_168690 [compost metagenome]
MFFFRNVYTLSRIKGYLKLLMWCILLSRLCTTVDLYAQTTPCDTPGAHFTGISEQGTASYAMGDLVILDGNNDPNNIFTADWYLSATSNVTVYASVTIQPGAIVRLKSGSVLSIYGSVDNKGLLFVEPGATIIFYGTVWQNDTDAVVGDGAPFPDTVSGGTIQFAAPRPVISPSVHASACVMDNYSGGNFEQILQGGNVPMDIILQVANPNNIRLEETDTRLSGMLDFAVPDGDILLNDRDFVFEKYAGYNWSIPDAREAFLITNNSIDTLTCKGMVQKEQIAAGSNFVFPIGLSETGSDGARNFSPIAVENRSVQTEIIRADVKSYAQVQAIGYTTGSPSDPAHDHLWRVHTTAGGEVAMAMMHRTGLTNDIDDLFVTPSGTFSTIMQFKDDRSTKNGKGGPRSLGTGLGNAGIASAAQGAYIFDTTAAGCDNKNTWFRKDTVSADSLLQFSIKRKGCTVDLDLHLKLDELAINRIEVWRSADSAGSISELTGLMVNAANDANTYHLNDAFPLQDLNRYQLRIVFEDSTSIDSPPLLIYIDCTQIHAFPNPVSDGWVYINGLEKGQVLQLYTTDGRLLHTIDVQKFCEPIDMRPYASAPYYIVVTQQQRRKAVLKIVRFGP